MQKQFYSSGIRDFLPHFLMSNNLKIGTACANVLKIPNTKQTLKRLMSPFLNSLDQGFYNKNRIKF